MLVQVPPGLLLLHRVARQVRQLARLECGLVTAEELERRPGCKASQACGRWCAGSDAAAAALHPAAVCMCACCVCMVLVPVHAQQGQAACALHGCGRRRARRAPRHMGRPSSAPVPPDITAAAAVVHPQRRVHEVQRVRLRAQVHDLVEPEEDNGICAGGMHIHTCPHRADAAAQLATLSWHNAASLGGRDAWQGGQGCKRTFPAPQPLSCGLKWGAMPPGGALLQL